MLQRWWDRERQEGGDLMLAAMFVVFMVCAAVAQVLPEKAPAPPALTEVEQLKVQVFRLTLDLEASVKESNDCRGALGTWRAEYQRGALLAAEQQLKADVEKGHPGYTFDTRSGAFTKVPDPPAATK